MNSELLIEDAGTIPVSDAIILWDDDPDLLAGHRITEVHVCPMSKQPSWTRRLDNGRGACDDGWMAGAMRGTPAGIFLEMVTVEGFASIDVKRQALREFAKIAGQDWSLNLLRQLPED